MTQTRKIITVFITVAAIAGCFVALKEESASVVAQQVQQEVSSESIVKGIQESVVPLSDASTDYSADAMAAHLELTPANIIWFTNYYRVQNNLAPLSESAQLNRSSADKLADMFEYQYFDHTRPGSNQTFNVFFEKEGYDFIKIGENLAMGNFTTSQQIVNAWMKSPEHKRNILDPVYIDIGVSVQSGVMAGSETYIIVQHFGKPRSACPVVDSDLDTKIKSLKSQITTLQTTIESEEGEVTTLDSNNSPGNASVNSDYEALVNSYNLMTTKLTSMVTTYNEQVTNYDACIQGS